MRSFSFARSRNAVSCLSICGMGVAGVSARSYCLALWSHFRSGHVPSLVKTRALTRSVKAGVLGSIWEILVAYANRCSQRPSHRCSRKGSVAFFWSAASFQDLVSCNIMSKVSIWTKTTRHDSTRRLRCCCSARSTARVKRVRVWFWFCASMAAVLDCLPFPLLLPRFLSPSPLRVLLLEGSASFWSGASVFDVDLPRRPDRFRNASSIWIPPSRFTSSKESRVAILGGVQEEDNLMQNQTLRKVCLSRFLKSKRAQGTKIMAIRWGVAQQAIDQGVNQRSTASVVQVASMSEVPAQFIRGHSISAKQALLGSCKLDRRITQETISVGSSKGLRNVVPEGRVQVQVEMQDRLLGCDGKG